MPLLTRTDLRITGVVSLRFSEALSGTISGVSDSHIDDSFVPARSCNSDTFLLFIGFNWFSKVFEPWDCGGHGAKSFRDTVASLPSSSLIRAKHGFVSVKLTSQTKASCLFLRTKFRIKTRPG